MNKKRLISCVLMSISLIGISLISNSYASQSNRNADVDLPEYVVNANRDTMIPGNDIVRSSDLGVVGKVDYMNIPITVTSFSNNVIKKYSYPGGTLLKVVTLDPNVEIYGSTTYNDTRIRGFRISGRDYYIDGVAGMLSQSSIPMNFVDKVEVLSGPSTLLYGMSTSGSVGGAINLVPKKATKNEVTYTETFSGKSNFEESVQIGHRFGKDRKWGAYISADTSAGKTEFINETMSRKNLFMNLDYASQKDKFNMLLGYRSVVQNGVNFSLDLNGEPLPAPPSGDSNFQLPWSHYDYNNRLVTVNYLHDFNSNWQGFLKAGYDDNSWEDCLDSWFPQLIDKKGDFEAVMEKVPLWAWHLSFSTGVRGKISTAKLDHNIVFSFDRLSGNGSGQDGDGAITYKGNIYDNSIKYNNPTPEKIALGPYYYSGAFMMRSFSLIDRINTKDDKWTFLTGLRYQDVVGYSKHDGKEYSVKGERSAVIPNFGIMYAIKPNVKFYANYMEGLTQGRFVSSHYKNKNEYLEPQKTKERELGVKWNTESISGVASVFSLKQENAYAIDGVYGYHGMQKNTGAQVTLYGKINPKLSLVGGVMYIKSIQEGGKKDGKDIAGIPNWHGILGLDYQINKKWSINGRIDYSGSTYVTDANKDKVPAWYRFDLGATYKKTYTNGQNMTWHLNVYNVLNKKYWVASRSDIVYVAGGRNVVLSASYTF